MYAIMEVGGRQWKVEPGTLLDINRVKHAVGEEVPVERVLLAQDGATVHVGKPFLTSAKIVCEVVEHRLGPKEISYHFRRRENWRKTVGHRQPLTRLLVKEIIVNGATKATAKVAAAPKAASSKTPSAKAAVVPKTPRIRQTKSLSKKRPSEGSHGA